MKDTDPQGHKADVRATSIADGLYDALVQSILDASRDPSRLRRVVYSIARHNLERDAVLLRAKADPRIFEQNLAKLEQALESAIKQVEAEASAPSGDSSQSWEKPSVALDPSNAGNPFAEGRQFSDYTTPQRVAQPHTTPQPISEPHTAPQLAAEPQRKPLGTYSTTTQNSLVVVPERMTLLEPRYERFQNWLDHRIQLSLQSVDYIPKPNPIWSGFVLFFQLVSGAAIGIIAIVIISGWPQLARQPLLAGKQLPSPAEIASTAWSTAPAGQAEPLRRNPALPFQLPRAFGVYAVSNGKLVELEPLPIKVPVPRVQLSAEITVPSKATVEGNQPMFVIYRRDLVNSAPQAVPVRVVARVSRAMQFVNGKPKIVPIEASWRIRDKAYDFKVSPLESNREMIVIQANSGVVLASGRYALVLNGYGYDFTVAGAVTAPEQCLEQVQVTNGIVLSECPKS